jgi:hypothetical protein
LNEKIGPGGALRRMPVDAFERAKFATGSDVLISLAVLQGEKSALGDRQRKSPYLM